MCYTADFNNEMCNFLPFKLHLNQVQEEPDTLLLVDMEVLKTSFNVSAADCLGHDKPLDTQLPRKSQNKRLELQSFWEEQVSIASVSRKQYPDQGTSGISAALF